MLNIAYFKSANWSFPLTYSPKSCDKEKLSIPLEVHHKAQSSEIFLSFQAKNYKSCNFFGQSCRNCIFRRPRWIAFKRLRLVEFRQRKVGVHTFLGWSKAGLLRRPLYRNYQRHNFFVLGPILVKFHVRTRLIESFPTIFWTWWCSSDLNNMKGCLSAEK